MALADIDALKTLMLAPPVQAHWGAVGSSNTGTGGFHQWLSLWANGIAPGGAGATPTTSVALDNTSSGRMHMPYTSSGNMNVLYSYCDQWLDDDARPREWLLIDRLVHQGGLVGNLNTTQTTNLPTTALTRYTSGAGVMMALEGFTSWGSTATVISVSYTNQAGTSGRTGTLGTIAGAGTAVSAKAFLPIGLQAGDSGVRSVESVTLSVSTGTAGNAGIVLYKPIAYIEQGNAPPQQVGAGIMGWNTPIEPGACLQKLIQPDDWFNGNDYSALLGLGEI